MAGFPGARHSGSVGQIAVAEFGNVFFQQGGELVYILPQAAFGRAGINRIDHIGRGSAGVDQCEAVVQDVAEPGPAELGNIFGL